MFPNTNNKVSFVCRIRLVQSLNLHAITQCHGAKVEPVKGCQHFEVKGYRLLGVKECQHLGAEMVKRDKNLQIEEEKEVCALANRIQVIFFIEHKFFSGCMVLTRRSMDNVLLNSEFTHIKLD